MGSMGRSLTWKVDEDLTEAEAMRVRDIIDSTIKPSIPKIASEIVRQRPPVSSLFKKLLTDLKDVQDRKYASSPSAISIVGGEVIIRPIVWHDDFVVSFVAGEYVGHTLGLQDYASIGVLAAASQVSGKVRLIDGDDIDAEYVSHILTRIALVSNVRIEPQGAFTSGLHAS